MRGSKQLISLSKRKGLLRSNKSQSSYGGLIPRDLVLTSNK